MTEVDEIEAQLKRLEAEKRKLLEARKAALPPVTEPTVTLKRRRLTDLSIRAIRPPASGRIQVPDSACPSLWLRISDRDARTWSYVYRASGDAKVKRYTIGRWPAITCAGARAAAKQVAAEVAAGKDPAREKAEKLHQNGDLVEQVAAEFVARVYRVRGLKSTADVESRLSKYVLPTLAGRRIGSVTKHDLLKLVDAVGDTGMPRATNKLVQLLRQLFRWAKGRGLLTVDPTEGLSKPFAEKSRDRVLSDDELSWIWTGAERLDWPWGTYVRLLILLGQRRTEVASMKWQDLDLTARVWNLRSEDTKMARARTLPLPGAAVELIEGLPRISGSDFVFGSKLSSFAVMKKQLDTISSASDWVLHDLRRTFATCQQRLWTKLEVTEQLLGHLSGSRSGVVGVYQRFDFMAEQRIALEKWSDFIARLIGGWSTKVVVLKHQ